MDNWEHREQKQVKYSSLLADILDLIENVFFMTCLLFKYRRLLQSPVSVGHRVIFFRKLNLIEMKWKSFVMANGW